MAGPSWTRKKDGDESKAAAKTGPSWTKPKTVAPPPSDMIPVEDFGDGSYIVMDRLGRRTFVDQKSGYSSPDPKLIDAIIESKQGRKYAAETYRGKAAQEIAGAGVTSTLDAATGIPFVGEYVPPAAALARSAVQGVPFNTALDTLQTSREYYNRENPKMAAAKRFGMGAAATIPFAMALPAETWVGKSLQGMAVGAPIGGLDALASGFGAGTFARDGSIEQGVEEAKARLPVGVGAGALFGAGGPVVAEGLGAAVRAYLREPVKETVEKIGFQRQAAKLVEDAMADDAAVAAQNAAASGPYGSLSTLGPNMTQLLDAVRNSQGEGAAIIKKNLDETALLASRDFDAKLNKVFGEPTTTKGEGLLKQKEKIMADTAENRRKLYGEAYDFIIDETSDAGQQIKAMFDSVDPSDLAKARKMLRMEGGDASLLGGKRIEAEDLAAAQATAPEGAVITSNADGSYTMSAPLKVETIDQVTRTLYDMAYKLKNEEPALSMSYSNLARKMRTALDDINPDYAKARAAGKDAIDQKLAADLGDSILSPRISREDVAIALETLDGVGANQLKLALRNRLDEIGANAKVNPTADNQQEVVEALAQLKALNTRAVANKIEMVFGTDTASEIGDQIRMTSQALMQKAIVNAGSKTNMRALIDERFKEIVGEPLGQTVGRQGIIGTVAGKTVDAVAGGRSQRERIRRLGAEVAPLLSQRMTPAQLKQKADLMEQMSGYIQRAEEGADVARNIGAGVGFGVGLQQSRSEEPSTQKLMQMLGVLPRGF